MLLPTDTLSPLKINLILGWLAATSKTLLLIKSKGIDALGKTFGLRVNLTAVPVLPLLLLVIFGLPISNSGIKSEPS